MTIKSGALLVLIPVSSLLLVACEGAPSTDETADGLSGTFATRTSDLVASKSESLLETKAPAIVPGRGVTLLPTKSQYCSDEFVAYVVYPMTVCDPPGLGGGVAELAALEVASTPSDASLTALAAEDSGLSTASSAAFTSPFCHIRGGPWFADAVTTESCVLGVPDHSTLAILGAPQPFSVAWDGDMSSVPPPFNPNVFAHFKQSCSCCPGFLACPNGGCLPYQVGCGNNGPPP